MRFKEMTEEQIQLDIEKINGYLSAIEMMNIAANICVDYTFIRLPQKHTLLESVESEIAQIYPDTIISNWHIKLEQICESQLSDSINIWFFRFGKAVVLSDELSDLCTGFMDMMKQLIYTPNIYRVTMRPPVWYAIDWEIFVFETKNGLFLLDFNFDS